MKQNRTLMLGIVLAISFLQFSVFATEKSASPSEEIAPAALPNAFIIGDSISMGYTGIVEGLLKGKANVSRPGRNCTHSGFGVGNVKVWLGEKKWDVIHFDFGIWDTHYMHNGRLVSEPADYAGKKRHSGMQSTSILTILKNTWSSQDNRYHTDLGQHYADSKNIMERRKTGRSH
jgi:hypothetical protein